MPGKGGEGGCSGPRDAEVEGRREADDEYSRCRVARPGVPGVVVGLSGQWLRLGPSRSRRSRRAWRPLMLSSGRSVPIPDERHTPDHGTEQPSSPQNLIKLAAGDDKTGPAGLGAGA